MAKAAREAYERAVSELAAVAASMRGEGKSVEEVARNLVRMRNELKAAFRELDPPALVAVMEQRNKMKYGHPLGPDADWLFDKYGSWELVIEAACRPLRLSNRL